VDLISRLTDVKGKRIVEAGVIGTGYRQAPSSEH